MNPAILAIILQNVPALAMQLANLLTSTTPPTQAQWDALLMACRVNAAAVMTDVLVKAGIDPTSDKGKAFLALVS